MANNILSELWYGQILPQDQLELDDPELQEIEQYTSKLYTELCSTLTEAQIEMLKKYDDKVNESTAKCEKAIFILGFKLGVKIMMESLK